MGMLRILCTFPQDILFPEDVEVHIFDVFHRIGAAVLNDERRVREIFEELSQRFRRAGFGDRVDAGAHRLQAYIGLKKLPDTLVDRAGFGGQEGTAKSVSYGMWNHPRGHVWNVFVRPASS